MTTLMRNLSSSFFFYFAVFYSHSDLYFCPEQFTCHLDRPVRWCHLLVSFKGCSFPRTCLLGILPDSRAQRAAVRSERPLVPQGRPPTPQGHFKGFWIAPQQPKGGRLHGILHKRLWVPWSLPLCSTHWSMAEHPPPSIPPIARPLRRP